MVKSILLAVLALTCAVTPALVSQSDRARAMQLWDEGKHAEALPLLEQLVVSSPGDRMVMERLGFGRLANAARLSDPDARKTERARGRAALVKARELGETSSVVSAMIAAIPEDGGGDVVFSGKKEVDEAIHRGETAYASEHFPEAIAAYQEALVFDPAQYDAALFTGDAYFRMKQADSAYRWYARAVAIDPDRETAYRYWSDVLKKENRMDEARDKAIEAIVAAPFSRTSRQALVQWAQAAKVAAGVPRIELPPKDSTAARTPAAMAYDSVHRSWKSTSGKLSAQFIAHYPGDTAYRHSVAEEVDALQAANRGADTTIMGANLKRLADAGLLEAFIFFARADEGISHDYRAYARDHHDTLMQFWREFVIGAKYAK